LPFLPLPYSLLSWPQPFDLLFIGLFHRLTAFAFPLASRQVIGAIGIGLPIAFDLGGTSAVGIATCRTG
jgi:hypothetical protein